MSLVSHRTPPKQDDAATGADESVAYRAKRKVLRTAITKDVNRATDHFTEVTAANQMEARVLLAKLEKLGEQVSACDDFILRNDTRSEQITAEIEQAMDYQMKLTETISRLNIQLQTIQQQSAAVGGAHSGTQKRIKTPKLELTTFEGDPLRWDEFWDDFSCSVDARTDLSIIDKFKILKQSLKGEALRVADGYYLTQNNYEEVKDVLKDRFGDPQVAIFAHFEALLEIKPSSHDVKDLVEMRDFCEAHIRGLVSLGVAEDTFGLVFAPILLSKLPRFVKMELNRRNGTNKWTLSSLRERLKEEIDARTKSDRSYSANPTDACDKTRKEQGLKAKKSVHRTATSLMVQADSKGKGQKGKKVTCLFCEGSHRNWECTKYPTTETRLPLVKGKCYLCFSDKHMMSSCSNARPCYYCGKKNHNSSLCFEKFGKLRSRETSNMCQAESQLNPEAPEFVNDRCYVTKHQSQNRAKSDGVAVFASAVAEIIGTKRRMKARLVLDNASSTSLIRKNLSKEIGTSSMGDPETSISRVGEHTGKYGKYPKVAFQLVLRNGSILDMTAREIEHVSAPLKLVPLELGEDGSKIPAEELAEVIVTEPTRAEIDLLVGLDFYYKLVGKELARTKNGLVFQQTEVGTIVTGYKTGDGGLSESDDRTMFTMHGPAEASDMTDLEKFWRLEDIGITDKPGADDDETALALFNESIQFEEGRYQLKFPFKADIPELPVNRGLSMGRLQSVYRHLKPNPTLLESYHRIFQDQLEKSVIEVAPAVPTGVVHYVPHHAVVTPGKETTKVRIVFDASAKPNKNTPSLNDTMYRGPVFLNDLCGMLIRFRLPAKAIITDVEKAFLQLGLQESHRDCTRFVWLGDPQQPPTGGNVIEYRYTRVPFGMKASPFLLAATILYHLRKAGTELAKDMERNTYMDNILGGRKTTPGAVEYRIEAKRLFAEMSMNLREWYCNDPEFMRSLPESDKGKSKEPTVLGIRWNIEMDTVRCSSQPIKEGPITKRTILKACASLFDPCGWFSPVTMRGKVLLQELWRLKYDWDSIVTGELARLWMAIEQDIANIQTCVLPRLYAGALGKDTADDLQLHAFCDASAKAYAVCIYLRVSGDHGVQAGLVFAKVRVAPLKDLTIPKLELLAVVIGVRLLNFVEKELMLPISYKRVWTDSMCVVDWLRKEKVHTVFVDNRLREIRSTTDAPITYVPTRDNPADIPTRGMALNDLKSCEMWWRGPAWLILSSETWPNKESISRERVCMEDPKENVESANSVLEEQQPSDCVFTLERYSTLNQLLRVTAYVKKAVKRFRGSPDDPGITATDLDRALRFWEKRIQTAYFQHLFKGEELPKRVKHLKSVLGLYVDEDGYIRCRGRYQNSEALQPVVKHPKLLPSHSPFTNLVIKKFHERVLHGGPKHTLALTRTQYWICQGRSRVRSVLWNCMVCRRHDGGPFKTPAMSPLPDYRSSIRRPFSCMGLDYLGPLSVRCEDRDDLQKVWICLFTCAVTRAIHLEVAASLGTQDFLLALRRFTAIYGMPQIIVSDNAKHFKLADQIITREVRKVLEAEEIQQYASNNGVEWRFITERSPWMGGFYERLVGCVKIALKKTIGKWTLTLSELTTIVYEVASVLNSRPLVYSEDDPSECVITPAHLLFRASDMFPDNPTDADEAEVRSKPQELVAHWRAGQQLLREFWNVWKSHYLLSLREYWRPIKDRNTSAIPAQVNAVVLVKDDLPRGLWKMGKVTELKKSQDGQVRSAVVQLANKTRINRPLRLLYPIEGGMDANEEEGPPSAASHATTTDKGLPSRPRRKAAKEAASRTRRMLQE